MGIMGLSRARVIAAALAVSLAGGCDTLSDWHDRARAANFDEDGATCSDGYRIGGNPVSRRINDHALIVDSLGHTDIRVKGGHDCFDAAFATVMAAYASHVAAGKRNELLIYVNGGLNTRSTIVESAFEQVPMMTAEPYGYFPVFLIWRTGAFETYGEQVGRVRNGLLRKRVRVTAPLYVTADLGTGVARAPIAFKDSFARLWDSTLVRDDRAFCLEGARPPQPDPDDPAAALYYDGDACERRPVVSENFPFYVLGTPARLVTTSFLDAMGRTAWENMLRRSRMTVRAASEFEHEFWPGDEADRLATIRRSPNGTGAFSRFFARLEDCRENAGCPWHAALRQARITLVGHSMGTIVLNDLIARYPDLPYRDIVYMAAAASIRDFRDKVVPVLAAAAKAATAAPSTETEGTRPDPRFYNLMLHPVAESRELSAYGLVLSGSLLEWIDDMFEGPKTPIDRTLGKWRNLRLAEHIFPAAVRPRMTFTVYGFDGGCATADNGLFRGPDPTTHGAFNDTEMRFWDRRYWIGWRKADGEGRPANEGDGTPPRCG